MRASLYVCRFHYYVLRSQARKRQEALKLRQKNATHLVTGFWKRRREKQSLEARFQLRKKVPSCL